VVCESVTETCYHIQYHRSDEYQFPKPQPHILQTGEIERKIMIIDIVDVPLNFLRGIMESSNFSSSLMITFLSLPSPITKRVLPQPNSSIHQKEYIGRKKLYTGYLIKQSDVVRQRGLTVRDARKKIDNHPTDEHEFSLDDEDDRLTDILIDIHKKQKDQTTHLQTVSHCQHDNSNLGERRRMYGYRDDQVHQLD